MTLRKTTIVINRFNGHFVIRDSVIKLFQKCFRS